MADHARVVVLTPDFPPAIGGIQHLMLRLVQNFHRLDTIVVALDGLGARIVDAQLDASVVRSRGSRHWHRPAVGMLNVKGAQAIVRARPDVVLCGHIAAAPGAHVAAAALGLPVVQYVYADEMASRPRLTRFATRRAESTIAISRYTRDLALAFGARTDRLRVIPPGVDLPAAPESSGERVGTPTIVTVGRLESAYKGFDVMLRALPLVRARIPGARWVVVGDGFLHPSLDALAASYGLDGAVEFLGSVDDARRDAILRSADVFAMPSRLPAGGRGGEGFGIVFLEASAHGLPVVAGNVGGALDAVVDGETGLLVDPTDHVAVAMAVIDLLEDPRRARRLGGNGPAHARRFSWPAVARRVEDVLLEAVRQRR